MQPTLLAQGRQLLDSLSEITRLSQLQSSITSKQGSTDSHQLQLLKEEKKKVYAKAAKHYASWFSAVEASLEKSDYLNEFRKTRDHLDLVQRVSLGVECIENIAKKSPSSNRPNTPWSNIIAGGENDRVEFKSSLRWDYKNNTLNKQLEFGVIKSIAALLNSKGGHLFIGVDDTGELIGVEKEFPTFRKQNSDGYVQYLLQLINAKLGKHFNKDIVIEITDINQKPVCIATVTPSPLPCFVKHENNEHFFIRASLTSQPLNVRETAEYIGSHWKN